MSKSISRRDFLFSLFPSLLLGGIIYVGCKKEEKNEFSFCLRPRTHSQRTIQAFLDTVIPGKENDPEGKPGAEEGCVINIFYDPTFSRWLSPFLELLANDLDSSSLYLYKKTFNNLSFEERTQVILAKEDYLYYPVIAFSLIAFYSGWYSTTGLEPIGFLPNRGGKDTSYGKQLAEEMTADGNLP